MKTATRFVFDFDEAQTSGRVLPACDAELLRRMIVERDAELIERCTKAANECPSKQATGAACSSCAGAVSRIRALDTKERG